MSETDDITGRWFKQLLTTLRETEMQAANEAPTTQQQSMYHSSLGGDQFGNSPLDEVSLKKK